MNKSKLIFWAVTASLAGFLFGFDTIVISGAEQAFKSAWQLGAGMHGWTMGAALWGTVIGAMFGGMPAARYGRKKTLVTVGFLYFVSALGSGLAYDIPGVAGSAVWVFVVARFIGGLGVGTATVASPMFISEISPANNRGKLAGMFQFNIVFGILIALVSNWLFGKYISDKIAWRWMLGIEAVPAFAYTIMTFMLPESPRWLITHANRHDEGREIFRQINPSASDAEIDQLVSEVEATAIQPDRRTRFWTSRLRIPIMLAILIAAFNQLSGINVVFYFSPRLIGLAGIENPLLASVSLGFTNLVFTFVGLWLIDKLGRRALLYVGSVGYIISLGICAWMFLSTPAFKPLTLSIQTSENAGKLISAEKEKGDKDYIYLTEKDRKKIRKDLDEQVTKLASHTASDWYAAQNVTVVKEGKTDVDKLIVGPDVTNKQIQKIAGEVKKHAGKMVGDRGIIVLFSLIAFIAAHAIGQGAVIWVFISEIFPNDHRAAGQALGSSTHWVFAASITTVFPTVLANVETGFIFSFLCFMMCLQLLWVKLMVPETKGITLEEMEKKLGID